MKPIVYCRHPLHAPLLIYGNNNRSIIKLSSIRKKRSQAVVFIFILFNKLEFFIRTYY